MNAFSIKWLAVILMVIDHVGFFLFPELKILRIIGRLSFPLFSFLIVNGYKYTRDIKKYFLRLFVFANLIQIPSLFTYLPVNIFYTLSLGLLCIVIYESKIDDLTKVLGISLLVVIAYLIKSDYGPYGVILIMVIHILYQRHILMALAIFLLSMAFYGGIHIQCFAALTPFIMKLYNDKPGPKMKYFFYLFYPVHMVFLNWLAGQL